MSIYKQAAQQKLRFDTTRGSLSAEQLFDLPLTVLATAIRNLRGIMKKEVQVEDDLSFLDQPVKANTANQLRFEILKDVYLTKKAEVAAVIADRERKERNQRIMELIKNKQDKELENKSIEELKAMLDD
jgi:hypothetical protein